MTRALDEIPSARRDAQRVEAAYARLREAIVKGELPPGDAILQERLAKTYEISRTPLREALRMLERDGLVVSEPNRSFRVAGFTMSEMEEIYVARLPIEAMAIYQTVPQLTTRDLAELEGLMAQMATYANAEDYDSWELPHRAFHSRLTSKAGSRISRMLSELSDHAERYRRYYTIEGPRAWNIGCDEHRAILDRCLAGEPAEAAFALVAHLSHTALSLIELVEPDYEPKALRIAVEMANSLSKERP